MIKVFKGRDPMLKDLVSVKGSDCRLWGQKDPDQAELHANSGGTSSTYEFRKARSGMVKTKHWQ